MATNWVSDSILAVAIRPTVLKLAARASKLCRFGQGTYVRIKDSVCLATVTLLIDLKTLKAHVLSPLDHVPNITVFMELKTAISQAALKSCFIAQDLLREADGNLELGAYPRHHCETLAKAKKVLHSVPRSPSTMKRGLSIITQRAASETSDYQNNLKLNASDTFVLYSKALSNSRATASVSFIQEKCFADY
ncbi:MAG: hypothetical protein BYD32DRAFT_465135 [Podila humilis]|nr:MAG: hypothetical protein BYD32DRAFT_465135 [Podila humilis]